MPRLRTETIGGGDQSWLGSAHGISNCRTETINVSAFTAGTHYPNGYIPSGLPVSRVNGLLEPYDPTVGVTTGRGVLAGHVFTDQPVTAGGSNVPAPVLDHGRVKVAKVAAIQAGFAAPTVLAKNATTVVYI